MTGLCGAGFLDSGRSPASSHRLNSHRRFSTRSTGRESSMCRGWISNYPHLSRAGLRTRPTTNRDPPYHEPRTTNREPRPATRDPRPATRELRVDPVREFHEKHVLRRCVEDAAEVAREVE